jgi:hypothetical protein
MTDETDAAGGDASSQHALLEVVKGLRHEPALLFGIGAGLVLIGILAATTSIAIVAIAAVIFLAALGAWLVRETRAQVADERTAHADVRKAEIGEDVDISVIEGAGSGRMTADVDAKGAKIGKGATIGSINSSGSRRRRRS